MTSALDRLKQHSSIVADTGDIEAIRKHQPEDATTNPSLLLKAAEMDAYQAYLKQAWDYAKTNEPNLDKQVELACDYFAVLIGKEIANIVPGYILTDMTRKSFNIKSLRNERINRMMIKRWGNVEDISGAAVFLASNASSYVTGIDLTIDGGWTAKGI